MMGAVLIVVSGLPGTGKSAAADALAVELDAVRVSIDEVEDALLGAGLERTWRTGVAAYEATRAAAEQNLALGRTVIVDAVNDGTLARQTWIGAASRTRSALVFVLLTLEDVDEHRRRLEGRSRPLLHVPEPTWAEVQRRAAGFEPWDGDVIRIDAGSAVAAVTRGILDRLRSLAVAAPAPPDAARTDRRAAPEG